MNNIKTSEKVISGFTSLRKTVEYNEKGKVKYKTVDNETGYVYEERTLEQEEKRKEILITIKKIYQDQSSFTKAINFVSGKNPSWKEIQEYTKEELDFLVQLNEGTTAYQKQRNERTKKQLEKKHTQEEIEKKITRLNKEDFFKALSSLGNLEIQKEISNRCK